MHFGGLRYSYTAASDPRGLLNHHRTLELRAWIFQEQGKSECVRKWGLESFMRAVVELPPECPTCFSISASWFLIFVLSLFSTFSTEPLFEVLLKMDCWGLSTHPLGQGEVGILLLQFCHGSWGRAGRFSFVREVLPFPGMFCGSPSATAITPSSSLTTIS